MKLKLKNVFLAYFLVSIAGLLYALVQLVSSSSNKTETSLRAGTMSDWFPAASLAPKTVPPRRSIQ